MVIQNDFWIFEGKLVIIYDKTSISIDQVEFLILYKLFYNLFVLVF